MSVPRFFTRVHAAVGRHLAVDRATLEARLAKITIGVECGPTDNQNATWIGELVTNQLARLYPRLSIFGDADGADRLRALAVSINPSIELADDPDVATACVSTVSAPRHGALHAAADGWSAILGDPAAAQSAEVNPFGAGAAAALAAGAVFRRILLGDDSAVPSVRLDLLSFEGERELSLPPRLNPLDIGSTLVVGVGAVGNAAIWALGRHPSLSGRVLIVEPEVVELSNLQRYVLTEDADVNRAKTILATRSLSATNLAVTTVEGRLGEVSIPDDVDNVLVTVDNIKGRRAAQALLPRLVVNGWTSDSGLGASWHDFRLGAACLACLYHPRGPAPSQTELVAQSLGLTPERAAILWVTPEVLSVRDIETIVAHFSADRDELKPWIGKRLQDAYTTLVCGSAPIAMRATGRVETVPLAHQSVLAGILAAAEFVKRTDPTLRDRLSPHNLVAWHDVTRAPPSRWLQRRSAEEGCICGDIDYREVFEEKWSARSQSS